MNIKRYFVEFRNNDEFNKNEFYILRKVINFMEGYLVYKCKYVNKNK